MHGSSRTTGRTLGLLALLAALAVSTVEAHEAGTLGGALGERWRWVHFTTWSGLPSDDVLVLMEDVGGTPWVGTAAGLAWFDGYRWQPVGREDGLPEAPVQSIAPLADGGVVVVVDRAAWTGGREGFRRVLTPQGTVRGAAELADGSLLVTIDGMLHRIRRDGTAEKVTRERPDTGADRIWSREPGRVLVGTWTGLLYTDGRRWDELAALAEPGVATADLSDAFETAPGRGLLTVTLPHHLQGAWWWDETGRLERADDGLNEAIVASAVHEPDELVVAYESGALGLFDFEDRSWRRISIPPAVGGVSALLFRGDGNLWAGTARGLWLFRASSERWSLPEPLPDGDLEVVHDVLLAADGRTWMATRGGLVIESPDGSREVLRELEGRPIPVVTTVAQDREGGIWIGSGSGFEGAWRLHRGAWRHYGPEDGLAAPRVHAVRLDRDGRPWFLGLSRHLMTGGPGAFRFAEGSFERVSLPGGVNAQRVYDFVETGDGALWFGTNEGLHRLKGNRWRSWTEADGLPRDRVFTLEPGPAGELWFTTGNDGVCLMAGEELAGCEGIADGLPNDAVWDLLFDETGALWASTRGGLGVRRDGAWSRLLPRHGLPLLRLWPLALQGESLLVGTNGRGLVELRLTEREHPPPRVDVLEQDVTEPLTRFEWRSSAWWGEQGEREVETRWRLDGGPWSDWERHEELVFEDLDPGEHVLEVEPKGLLGQRPDAPERLAFTVPAPLLARPEFVVPVVLVFVALAGWVGFGLHRRRVFAAELAQREARFREILDNASDAIFTAGLDGRLTMLNRAGRELAGLGDRDPAELDWYGLLGEEARERAAAALRRKLAGERSSTYEITLPREGEETRVLEVHSRLVRAPGREPEIQGVARDVTERRRIERELRESQKLESLGLLAGGVAHDFNNLLLAILGNLDLARGAWRAGRSPATALDDLEAAAERATDLARVMLAYSGRARFEVRPLDLSALASEILRLLRASLPKNVEFDAELPQGLPAVEGDRAQLQQVVLNLVTNAADALGEDGGRIRISVRTGAASELARGEPVLDGELGERVACLEVSDEGPGMDAGTRARIFDPFFSTKGSGRGLGLSAVLGIVRVHGGALLLDCPPGGGTSFRVLLTALAEPAPAEGSPRPAERAPGDELRGARILVVDDEERVRDVACRLLERLGCEIVEAADGLEAQQRVKEEGERLDAVLLDLVMPRCGGPEALAAIRGIRPGLPVVLTSGYSEDEVAAREVGQGAAGFLMKPYRLADLERTMRGAVRSRQRQS